MSVILNRVFHARTFEFPINYPRISVRMPIIAIGHKSRVGKDVAADYIKSRYGGSILKFSKPVYDLMYSGQKRLNKPANKDPLALQKIATAYKEIYGDDVFVNEMRSEIEWKRKIFGAEHRLIIGDVRHKNEVKMLREYGAIFIRIDRKNRPIDRDPAHISEVDLDDFDYDYIIENNGGIMDFQKNIDEVVDKIAPLL